MKACCTRFSQTRDGILGLVASPKGMTFVTLRQSVQAVLEALERMAPNPQQLNHCHCDQWFDQVEQALAHPGTAQSLKVPLDISGSPFQLAVWKVIAQIPAGRVMSYGEVAEQAGYAKAARAVGSACGANPVPLLIPCHRVVAANGLGGFGMDLALKRKWLRQEGVKSF